MIKFFKIQIFPILLSAAVIVAVFGAFTDLVLFLAFPVIFAAAAVFYFCAYVKDNKAAFYYIIALLLVLFIFFMLVSSRGEDMSFIEWVLTGDLESGPTAYFVSLFVLCVFFVPSVIFYFTNVIYRAPFLLLVLIIPCLLHVRKYDEISFVYLVLFIMLYFIVMIFWGNDGIKSPVKHVSGSACKGAVGVFMLSLFLLSFGVSSIKAPASPVQNNPLQNTSIDALFRYNSYSELGGNDRNADQILFLVEADEQIYFIRQVFGKFDGKRWSPVDDSDLESGSYSWEEYSAKLNFDELFEYIQKTGSDKLAGIENLKNTEQEKTIKIIPQGYATRYVLAPSRTFEVAGVQNGLEYFRNSLDEIFLNGRTVMDPEKAYYVTYYSEIFRKNKEFQNYSSRFEADEFGESLIELLAADWQYANEYNEAAFYFANEWSLAQQYSKVSKGDVSEDIKNLAEEIVAGKDSDYEKALALERYFSDNGYKYDINYRPPQGKEDIEYFIFESKTGSCSHYATAMTLMARSVGLNTRYAEGFTTTEKNDQGQYVIRVKNSHAFPQIFIPVYGWVTFEPTVASASVSGAGSVSAAIQRIINNNVLGIFTALTFLILACALSGFVYTYLIAEKLFRRKVAKSDGRKGVILMYAKMVKLAHIKLGIFNVSAAALAQTVMDKYGLNIKPLTDCFERAAFNNEDISKNEKDMALNVYIQYYAKVCSKQQASAHYLKNIQIQMHGGSLDV